MSDWDSLAAAMTRMAVGVPKAAADGRKKAANDTLGKVKANASGRPGPRRVTGDYTRSMNVAHSGDESVVSTNAAQALRLEHGFHGADSRGRHYNQGPLPHWRPAFEWGQPRFIAYVSDGVAQVIG